MTIRKISAKKVARGEVYRIKKSPVKRSNPARKKKEFARCYGSKARVLWIQAQRCVACGHSPSENAHIEGDGAGRKASFEKVVPLCGLRPSVRPGFLASVGCHAHLHRIGRHAFENHYGIDLNAEADRTHAAWLSFSGGSPKPEKSND